VAVDSRSRKYVRRDGRVYPNSIGRASPGRVAPICDCRKDWRARHWQHAIQQHRPNAPASRNGWTWVARAGQRTPINTEAKYLLLRHAFETLGCMRVELKTDSLNERSRAAILRIGAREEGIFRNHMITASGRIRHSVYFSIIDSEWPEVKTRLESKLNR
jgi:RimJ/RimL family protein N-acetyltransferase